MRRMIRDCLDLREKYVYREEIAPWMKVTRGESHVNADPFRFVTIDATAVSVHYPLLVDGLT